MPDSLEVAKRVLSENIRILYGVFGIIESSGYFPPRTFLNEFLMRGNDPCDQDGRMKSWLPISLSSEQYSVLKEWWISNHGDAIEDSLGVHSWDDWIQEVLNR